MPFDLQTLPLLPEEPGVYLMRDAGGAVLYIGKAKNLRARVRQYFTLQDERVMVPFLTAQVETVETIVALTERDALLLENNLIKQHRPKYNVLLKDDKSYISLFLTKHKWPMLRLIRAKGKPAEAGTLFGPYTNAHAARTTLELIQKLFPLRQCSDAEFALRKRPCLLYDMKRCCAPCVGKCTQEEYQGYLEGAKRLLKGQDKELIRELKGLMQEAAEKLEFEKADALHKTLQQIEHVTQIQHVDNPAAQDADAIGLHREGSAVLLALLLFRNGKLIGSEHFSFHELAASDEEVLESFILQRYQYLEHPPIEILLPRKVTPSLQGLLKPQLLVPERGPRASLLEMAERNASALFVREQDARSLHEKQLLELQEALGLLRFPRRIECFDTSNISGTDPVASLATFTNGTYDKSRTRLYKIRGSGDDASAMREVLHRRLSKGDFPDLLIVDGGKGQLNIALKLFEEFSIATTDLIALTKEGARHDKGLTRERIYLPHQKDPLEVDPRSPLLFLLQRIRDEAHRLAISYHRKRRTKRTVATALEEVPGIGPTKARKLLRHFGSLHAVRLATDEALLAVPGITKRDVAALKASLEHKG